MSEEINLRAVTIKLNLNKDLNINAVGTKMVFKITKTSKKLEKINLHIQQDFGWKILIFWQKTIVFEKWFFQYNPETNDKIFLSTTNKMQCYTIFFITVNALHVSGSFSAHYQELKNCTHSIRYM